MSLEQWQENGWIRRVEASASDLANLIGVARREVADASLADISADGRFDHAYGAVRALCQVALLASGYSTTKGTREHERTIESIKFTIDGQWTERADYLDRCRRIRHQSLYDRAGVVQIRDADKLLETAQSLLGAIDDWLRRDHPGLLS